MKKYIFTFLVTSCVTFGHAQNLSEGLLLHYDFNGNANDVSGNDLHSTVFGATLVADREGNPNSAYYFNGIDDYIEMPNDPSLKPPLPLTIAFWVKFDDISTTYNSLVLDTDFLEDRYTGVFITAYDGYLAISYGDGTPGVTGFATRRSKKGATRLQEDVWYHVVGIIRDATDMDIYIDCVNDEGVYEGSGGSMVYSNNPGSIGRIDTNIDLPPRYLKGTLDDIRYWDRDLTEQEITLLCESTDNVHYLGVKESMLHSVVVYPNPVNEMLFIDLSSTELSDFTISIYDMAGKLLVETTQYEATRLEMDMSQLVTGMYQLRIKSEKDVFVKKIIKN
jgi:hypothetical protein